MTTNWICPNGHKLETVQISELLSEVPAFCLFCKMPTVPVTEVEND